MGPFAVRMGMGLVVPAMRTNWFMVEHLSVDALLEQRGGQLIQICVGWSLEFAQSDQQVV